MFSFRKLFGDTTNKRFLKQLEPVVRRINELEPSMQSLQDGDFPKKTEELKARHEKGESLDSLVPEAFALVREAAKRVLGERHYDVQLLGGVALHKGNIAEMRTGEGKTLVGTLPTYLNALSNRGVHVVTVNDYLSRRDAVWMGQVYAFLGLTVGVINSHASYRYDPTHTQGSQEDAERDELGSFKIQYDYLRPCERKEAYASDITYGTNSEFGFDYLRDNIEYKPEGLRQRGHVFAIVDEIDSILIDEARTPLIISAPAQESENLYETFAHIVRNFKEEEDYTVDEKLRAVQLTDVAIEKAERSLSIENLYTEGGVKYVHHLETAVRAKALFTKDKQYVVRDNQVVIVDEFTGRLQPGRRWSDGLHQAIEAKEGVMIQKEARTFASITYQNYFRMYEKLAGMTGTALTSQEEFYSVYKLDVITIPTHRPIARIDNHDYIFQNERGKLKAIAKKVRELHQKGQPVLIGTVSIEKNEELSRYLTEEGIPHEMLNAKNHEREGEIIAQAGRRGCVTIATNMAGRGVDIKLGGNPSTPEEYEAVKSLGGLYVLGTERHEARRIDNQLRGRAGRQGDPGETQFFVSLEDSLMRVFASDTVKAVMGKLNIPEDEPIQNGMISRSLESAQTKIEGFHFDTRKRVLAFDNVLNKQRESIYTKRRMLLLGANEEVEAYVKEVIEGDEEAEGVFAQKSQTLGVDFYEALRRLALSAIDALWVDHLESMEYLRGSVNLRAYGQRDPLIEYRKEALTLFRELEADIDKQIVTLLPNIGGETQMREAQKMREAYEKAKLIAHTEMTEGSTTEQTPIRNEARFGRNDQVTITDGKEVKTMKYKKAEELLQSGWKLVEEKKAA